MSLSRTSLAAGVALLALAAASQASASAFYLQEQSVRGTGRAYSGEVADKGVGSLWWNPASIAGIEKSEGYFGLNMIQVNSKVTTTGSSITRPVPPAGLNTPTAGEMGGAFAIPSQQKKSNLPLAGGKQVSHNQTFGAETTRTGVPRRTPG